MAWLLKPAVASKPFVPPYAVSGAYESLLKAFETTVTGANRTVKLPSRAVSASFHAVSSTKAVFSRSLYLRDWPHKKKLSPGRRLDVVISARETFHTRPVWSLTRSTVYANYLVAASDSAARLVQAVHFDFDAGGQDCHPYFHVQLTDEVIDDSLIEDLRSDGFELELKPCTGNRSSWVVTRIPTSDMTLASVLYCLVADHLPRDFAEFARQVHSIQNRLPRPAFSALRTSLSGSHHFKSSHWYAHMPNLGRP